MIMNNMKKSLTLVELLISVVIVTMIFFVVLQVYVTNQRFIEQNKNEIDARSSVRQVYWYLKHDLREAYANSNNVVMDSVGDSFTINSLAGNITYSISGTSDNGFLLSRDGRTIAYDVAIFNLTNTTMGMELEIQSKGSSFYGRPYQIHLKQVINKRN